MTTSTPLNEAAKEFAASQNYDLTALISLMCSDVEKKAHLPFVEECRRSRRYMTTMWQGRRTENDLMPSAVFKYNPVLIKKYVERNALDSQEVASLLIELAQGGIDYLDSKLSVNAMGSVKWKELLASNISFSK